MSYRECSEESFLKDVEKHEIKVLLDNGVYRHIRFEKPTSSDMYFEIVTWPGCLAYSGDMGDYIFSRTKDMFEFFRDYEKSGPLHINLPYWGEKLEAVDYTGKYDSGFKKFSSERFKEYVEEVAKSWIETIEGPYDSDEEDEAKAKKEFEETLKEAIDDQIYHYLDDGEYELRRAVNDFLLKVGNDKYTFEDTWEWDCDEYVFRFVWCCYALAWGIRRYDESKVETAQTK